MSTKCQRAAQQALTKTTAVPPAFGRRVGSLRGDLEREVGPPNPEEEARVAGDGGRDPPCQGRAETHPHQPGRGGFGRRDPGRILGFFPRASLGGRGFRNVGFGSGGRRCGRRFGGRPRCGRGRRVGSRGGWRGDGCACCGSGRSGDALRGSDGPGCRGRLGSQEVDLQADGEAHLRQELYAVAVLGDEVAFAHEQAIRLVPFDVTIDRVVGPADADRDVDRGVLAKWVVADPMGDVAAELGIVPTAVHRSVDAIVEDDVEVGFGGCGAAGKPGDRRRERGTEHQQARQTAATTRVAHPGRPSTARRPRWRDTTASAGGRHELSAGNHTLTRILDHPIVAGGGRGPAIDPMAADGCHRRHFGRHQGCARAAISAKPAWPIRCRASRVAASCRRAPRSSSSRPPSCTARRRCCRPGS